MNGQGYGVIARCCAAIARGCAVSARQFGVILQPVAVRFWNLGRSEGGF